MSLLDDIQEGVTSSLDELPGALRRAKLLAAKWKYTPLLEWCDLELQGYGHEFVVPDYRVHRTVVRISYMDGFRHGKNIPVPTDDLPDDMRESLTVWRAKDTVDVYLDMLKSDAPSYHIAWGGEIVGIYQRMLDEDSIYEVHSAIARSQLVKLVNAVRDRLLDFTIRVRDEVSGAEEERSLSSPNDKSRLDRLMGITINNHGPSNVAVGSEQFTQNMTVNVQPNDLESLAADLRDKVGLPEESLETLRAVVLEEPQSENGTFGPRLSKWLADTTGAIATGAIKAELVTAIPHMVVPQ